MVTIRDVVRLQLVFIEVAGAVPGEWDVINEVDERDIGTVKTDGRRRRISSPHTDW